MSLPSAMSSSPSLLHSEQPSSRRRSGSFDAGYNIVGHGVGLSTVNSRQSYQQPPVQRRRIGLSRLAYSSRMSEYSPPVKFDPFASDDAPSQAWQHAPSVKTKSASPTSHFTIQLPNFSTRSLPSTNKSHPIVPIAAPPKPDKNARARIVAGILLNRIYAVGKPMRRRMASSIASKAYVPSGLSSVVTVEC